MLHRIRAALSSDRGEASAISIVLGTLLFLAATGGTVAVVGNIMAVTAVTRQNTIIESALKDRVQNFLSESAGAADSSSAATTTTVTYQGLTFPITSQQAYFLSPTAILYTVAAPMATVGGANRADCTGALSKPVPGCLSLSGTRNYNPQDSSATADFDSKSNVHAFAGVTYGPMTINTSQKVLNIATVSPSAVLSSDPMRVQVTWNSATPPNATQYGLYCGSSTTPQMLLTPTSQTYKGQASLILELTPASLKGVAGCSTATIGLSTGGSAVPVASVGGVAWWRILPTTGVPE